MSEGNSSKAFQGILKHVKPPDLQGRSRSFKGHPGASRDSQELQGVSEEFLKRSLKGFKALQQGLGLALGSPESYFETLGFQEP